MRFGLFFLMAVWMSTASASMSCESLSKDISGILKTEPQWTLLDIENLVEDDQELWQQHHMGSCPGAVAVDLAGSGERSYALALLRNDGRRGVSEKVIIATWKNGRLVKRILVPATNIKYTEVASPFVIWKVSAGTYRDLVTGSEIKIRHEGIVCEKIEATATLYYFQDKRYKSILLSE